MRFNDLNIACFYLEYKDSALVSLSKQYLTKVWILFWWYFSFPAIYLTSIVTICGINVLIQIMIMKLHFVSPVREVPKFLKMVHQCICCLSSPDGKAANPNNNIIEKETGSEEHGEVDDHTKRSTNANSDLLNDIRVLSDKVRIDEKNDALLQEWKSIADTFDRLFACVFVLGQIAAVIICFGILPFAWYSSGLLVPRTWNVGIRSNS